jgi:hypothetical protein
VKSCSEFKTLKSLDIKRDLMHTWLTSTWNSKRNDVWVFEKPWTPSRLLRHVLLRYLFRIACKSLLTRGPTKILSDRNYPCPKRCSTTKQGLITTDSKNLTRECSTRNQEQAQTVWVLSIELPSIIPCNNFFLASHLPNFSKYGRTVNTRYVW